MGSFMVGSFKWPLWLCRQKHQCKIHWLWIHYPQWCWGRSSRGTPGWGMGARRWTEGGLVGSLVWLEDAGLSHWMAFVESVRPVGAFMSCYECLYLGAACILLQLQGWGSDISWPVLRWGWGTLWGNPSSMLSWGWRFLGERTWRRWRRSWQNVWMLPSPRGWVFWLHWSFPNFWLPVAFIAVGVIRRVHRSVVGSLIPYKITLSWCLLHILCQ